MRSAANNLSTLREYSTKGILHGMELTWHVWRQEKEKCAIGQCSCVGLQLKKNSVVFATKLVFSSANLWLSYYGTLYFCLWGRVWIPNASLWRTCDGRLWPGSNLTNLSEMILSVPSVLLSSNTRMDLNGSKALALSDICRQLWRVSSHIEQLIGFRSLVTM